MNVHRNGGIAGVDQSDSGASSVIKSDVFASYVFYFAYVRGLFNKSCDKDVHCES